ncbi:MAG: FkbM family methyltransferase, partial [Actinomycetota bacterium]
MTTSTPSVFLDIGAHSGETLVVAQHRRWGFDHVHCFEPASSCVAALRRLVTDDSRVTIHPVALWDRAGELTLHGAGAVGASLFDDKPTPDRATVSETVPTV